MGKRKQKKSSGGSAIMQQGELMPWLFVLPALIIIFVYIAYPTIYTFYLSLLNSDSSDWASTACREGEACWGLFENYRYVFTSDVMLRSFRNNALWLVVMVTGVTAAGLLIAVLVDRVKYEAVAKATQTKPWLKLAKNIGDEPGYLNSADFTAFQEKEFNRYRKLFTALGLLIK